MCAEDQDIQTSTRLMLWFAEPHCLGLIKIFCFQTLKLESRNFMYLEEVMENNSWERGLAVSSSDRKCEGRGFKATAQHSWESVFTSSPGLTQAM